MHIVFATVEFLSEGIESCGGLAQYIAKAAHIYARKGNRVTVIVLSKRGNTFEYEKNVRVVRIPQNTVERDLILSKLGNKELKGVAASVWNSYLVNKRIAQIDKEEKVDVVQYTHLGALALFRNRKIPAIVRMSSFSPVGLEARKADFNSANIGSVPILPAQKIDFAAMRRADAVFAPCRLTAMLAERVLKKTVSVKESPAMPIQNMQNTTLPKELSGKKYYLYFGALSNHKNARLLIDAVWKMVKNNPEFYFVIAGKDLGISDGKGRLSPAIPQIMAAAGEYAKRVIYLGDLGDRTILGTLIENAEFCLLPYRFENLPNTCIEAMEHGKIVVSTYRSGVSQLIKDGYNGFLIGQNNPEELVSAVGRVLAMEESERQRFRTNTLKRVSQMSSENFYKYMMDYYRAVIGRKR